MISFRIRRNALPESFASLSTPVWAALLLLGAGCLNIPDSFQAPDLDSEWLLPLVKADYRLENLEDLAVLEFEEYVTAEDLGLAFQASSHEERRSEVLGPYIVDWDEDVVYAEAGLIRIDVELDNDLPANFFSTAILRVEQTSTGNVLIEEAVDVALPENGYFVDSLFLTDVELFSDLSLYVEDLDGEVVPGSTIPDGDGINLYVRIELEDIRRVDLRADAEVVVADTIPLELDLPDEWDEQEWNAQGTLRLFVENSLPLAAEGQLYVLDATGNVLDSLLEESSVLVLPTIGPDGTSTGSAQRLIEINLSKSRLEDLDDAEEIQYVLSAGTPSDPTILTAVRENGISFASSLQLRAQFQP
jgi:hypothetical protein